MAVDLSTCTGCNACSGVSGREQHPVVGRKEVINNREMSWIRIDRYSAASSRIPRSCSQPIACQHCEQAPCEQVCPVGATRTPTRPQRHGLQPLHRHAVLRKNCPYKVRRFTSSTGTTSWRDARNKVRRLLFNPRYGRMRGVMEKCTFCVQRIQNAKIRGQAQIAPPAAGQRQRPLPDGESRPRASRPCPTEAIVFGDLSDRTRVSRLHEDRRSYALLPDLHQAAATGPRADQNPNPNSSRAAGWSRMSSGDATIDPHHAEAGKAREAFRAVTRDVAWVAEAPKPHKAWLAALASR